MDTVVIRYTCMNHFLGYSSFQAVYNFLPLDIVFLHVVPHTAVNMVGAFNLNPATIKSAMDFLNNALNEEGQVTIGGRAIKYSAKGRVHSIDELWVYDGTAWDIASGIKVKKHHFDEPQDAIDAAMKELLDRLRSEGLLKDEL
ncbi:uncharacterized protein LOC110978263 [Acanthaster planci]|uniref:Uncharacterized protein LOC110978263 n=1 Tax=Acanthaster planci TaxID=133434 RepID=A0A8B7YAR4_ACAPL|nr:uncharacterized protein LOC110978263 [Acanthaster planci]